MLAVIAFDKNIGYSWKPIDNKKLNNMKYFLLFGLVSLSVICKSQTNKPKVFIEFNNESEGWINEFLEKSGNWTIVGAASESNAIFRVQISQNAYRAFGKIFIVDSETLETLYTTPNLKGQSSAFNGYAPKKNLAKKLIEDIEEKFDRNKINLTHYGRANNTKTTDGNDKSKIESDKYDKLAKLKKLLDDGAISKEEFEKEKKKILEEN